MPAVSIVHLIPSDGVGGVEVAARTVPPEPQPGVQFRLLLIAGRALGQAPATLESDFASALNPAAQLSAVRALQRLSPDVLICSLWKSMPAALLFKLLRPRTPLVVMLHSAATFHFADRLLHWLALAVADEVWADSAETLAARAPARPVPTRTLSFVLDRLAPPPAPPPGDVLKLVTWSRLSPEKGIDRAIELVRALRDRGIAVCFDIWGPDGGAEAALRRQVHDRALDEVVRFRGVAQRDRLPAIAADNTMFLQLSRVEGMAMGVVEAMQLGLVPVVTPVGQIPHYVRHGETGILVDPDQLGAAADALIALAADEKAAARVRTQAIAHWQSAPLYADELVALATALATRRARREKAA